MIKNISRRRITESLVLGSASLGVKTSSANQHKRKSFVFVHGTWHGGWVWRDVRRNLTKQGHDAFTPSCTGCGDRKHLMNKDITLETHINDIVNLIEYEELENIILVGHSFAGLVITGVADRLKHLIGHLVFLDALVPTEKRKSAVRKSTNGSYSEYWLKRKEKFIDGYQMNFFDEYPIKMLVPEENTDQVQWLKRRITPHPATSWTDKLILNNKGWQNVRRTYIHCKGQQFSQTSDDMIGPARMGEGWNFIETQWSRNAMVTHPNELSELLVTLKI